MRLLVALTPIFLALMPATAMAAGEEPPPAGGAATDQIVIATGGAMLLTLGLVVFGVGYRSGRIPIFGKVAAFSERVGGMPSWAAIPATVLTVSLLTAFLGFMWDVSIHIADGRDEGPLANPAHYLILAGLFGILTAGWLAAILPKGEVGPTGVKVAPNWHVPLGGVLLLAAGSFSLIGFPLDDVWHRTFGQDVTLWGPTHLMLLGGAAMSLLALAVLLVEATRFQGGTTGRPESAGGPVWVAWLQKVALTGGFLIGLSIFQAEFDFGVPQFRFIFQPMLIGLAGGAALVAARVWLGAGAALGAALFYLAVRGAITVIVGPILGEPTPWFPLYLVMALLVEAIAFRVKPHQTLRFAVVCGVVLGTVGMFTEYLWSEAVMPHAWTTDLLPEAMLFGGIMTVAAAVIGGWIGERLSSDRVAPNPRFRPIAAGAAVCVAALIAYGLVTPSIDGVRGEVTLSQVTGGPENREAIATVRVSPPDAAQGTEWFTAMAWQGEGFQVDELEPVAGQPGTFRTPEPIPLHGTWKTVIRMQKGDGLATLPVYLPEDAAIPVKGIPAPARFNRAFVEEKEILQREVKDVSDWLWTGGLAVVILITLILLSGFAWALHQLSVTRIGGRPPEPGTQPAPGRRAVPAPS